MRLHYIILGIISLLLCSCAKSVLINPKPHSYLAERQYAIRLFSGIDANGKPIAPNYPEALKWMKWAAEKGDPKAQEFLAADHDFGWILEKKWLAVMKGFYDANFLLRLDGNMFPEAMMAPIQALAKKECGFFSVLANQGNPKAQTLLADCYYNGIGVEQNVKVAIPWYEKAAQSGSARAMLMLGEIFSASTWNPQLVNQKDPEKSRLWFRKAADLGNTLAQYYLSMEAEKNHNSKEKLYWLDQSAHSGWAQAQYLLALHFLGTSKTQSNSGLAFDWLLRAANQNHKPAQLKLAESYKAGIGTPIDKTQALKWELIYNLTQPAHMSGESRFESPEILANRIREIKNTYMKQLPAEEVTTAERLASGFVPLSMSSYSKAPLLSEDSILFDRDSDGVF